MICILNKIHQWFLPTGDLQHNFESFIWRRQIQSTEAFLWDLYITVLSSGIWGEFLIALCCRIGEKVEPLRAPRESWGPKGPLSLRQMCTQKEWKTRLSDVKQWKRLQERASFRPKRQNISFPVTQPLDVCLFPITCHFIIISGGAWQPASC